MSARSTAIELIEQLAPEAPCTVAADKAYDTLAFVTKLRQINATPHVAQNIERNGGSAIDRRTTRHAGYALSLRARKLLEEAFGWGKDIGLLRRPKFRGRHKIEYAALLTFTGFNLVRMRNLLAPAFR